MQWLSSPGSVANYPLPNFIRRGSERAERRVAARASSVKEEENVSLGRRGRVHPGVRFPTPNLSYGKHKNCDEKPASSRQSVTCVETTENGNACADAARRGLVRAPNSATRRTERSVSHPVVPAPICPRSGGRGALKGCLLLSSTSIEVGSKRKRRSVPRTRVSCRAAVRSPKGPSTPRPRRRLRLRFPAAAPQTPRACRLSVAPPKTWR